MSKLSKLALCLWLLTQPACHLILGGLAGTALSDKGKEEEKEEPKESKASGCADHCNPSMCDTQRCWCYRCVGWCPF